MGAEKWPGGRHSLDWYEVAGLMKEMEDASETSITLSLQALSKGGTPDLLLTATAVSLNPDVPEAKRLVSVKCRASSLRLVSLRALSIFLLYQLDFENDLVSAEETDGA